MSKRKVIKLVLALIFIIGGVSLFVYPRITDLLYKDKVNSLQKIYIKKIISQEDNPKLEELYKLLKEENEKIVNDNQHRFLVDQTFDITDINLADYGIDNLVFGFINIPRINLTLPIYFGSSEENMRLGATHLTGSSYPIGGENTNSVIAAHRGFYKTEMFRHIDKIQIGDELIITNPYQELKYIAYKIDIVKPDQLDKLTIQNGLDLVTIMSCHPFPKNTHRYIVYFKRV